MMQSTFPGPQQNGDRKIGEITRYLEIKSYTPAQLNEKELSKDVKIKYTKILDEANAVTSEKFIGVDHYKKKEDQRINKKENWENLKLVICKDSVP